MFQAFVELGSSLPALVLTTDTNGAPVNLDALPKYQGYGPDGPLAGVAGSMTFKHSGSVTAATNTSPIAITSATHGLSTGEVVTVSGVGGNTAANGTFTVTVSDANTFSLDGSVGNGVYTAGGTWNVTGLYTATVSVAGVNGFEGGLPYHLLVQGKRGGNPYSQIVTFGVC